MAPEDAQGDTDLLLHEDIRQLSYRKQGRKATLVPGIHVHVLALLITSDSKGVALLKDVALLK